MNPDGIVELEYDPIAAEHWARRPDECDWKYAAFQSFRNAGPSRTFDDATEAVDLFQIQAAEDPVTGLIFLDPVAHDDEGNSLPPPRHSHVSDRVKEWAKKHDWLSRCAAWDLVVQKQYGDRTVSGEEKRAKHEQDLLRGFEGLSRTILGTCAHAAQCPERAGEIADLPIEQQVDMVLKLGGQWSATLTADRVLQDLRANRKERERNRNSTGTVITVKTVQPIRKNKINVDALLNIVDSHVGCEEDLTEPVKTDHAEYAEGEYEGTPRDYTGSFSIRDVRKRKERKSDAESGPVSSPLRSDDVTDGFESAAECVDAPPAAPGSDLMDADAGPGNAPSQRDELPEKFESVADATYDAVTLSQIEEDLKRTKQSPAARST